MRRVTITFVTMKTENHFARIYMKSNHLFFLLFIGCIFTLSNGMNRSSSIFSQFMQFAWERSQQQQQDLIKMYQSHHSHPQQKTTTIPVKETKKN